MTALLDITLKLSLVLFMAGSLSGMGLVLKATDALAGLRNVRFVGYSVVLGFVVWPLFAFVVTRIIPMDEPYAIGLLLLGMAPCTPFLLAMAARANTETNYTAAMMILAAVGTVLLLPLAVPYVIKGVTVDAWAIARPLVALVLIPLVMGMIVFRMFPSTAAVIMPAVKAVTAVATVTMLVVCAIIYGRDFVGAVGSYAILAQLVFLTGMTLAGYLFSRGLPPTQRSVIGLGLCTRNAGAALAPLMAMGASDRRSIVMVVIAVLLQIIVALIAANWFRRDAARPAVTGWRRNMTVCVDHYGTASLVLSGINDGHGHDVQPCDEIDWPNRPEPGRFLHRRSHDFI